MSLFLFNTAHNLEKQTLKQRKNIDWYRRGDNDNHPHTKNSMNIPVQQETDEGPMLS